MNRENHEKLNQVINDLTYFLQSEYSSRFKKLSPHEDRQLFFLANILVRIKQVAKDLKSSEKLLVFPSRLVKK